MNIISNNCLAGYIYRDILKCKFQNPFIWTRIWPDDLFNLIKNFETINFHNFQLDKENTDLSKFFIKIDNNIKVYYNHCIFSAKDGVPRVENNCVYYNKIWEYIVNKFNTRLCRMLSIKEKPIVIVEDLHRDEELVNLCKEKGFRLLLFTNCLKPCNTKDLVILPHNLNTSDPAKYVMKYKNEIVRFLNLT